VTRATMRPIPSAAAPYVVALVAIVLLVLGTASVVGNAPRAGSSVGPDGLRRADTARELSISVGRGARLLPLKEGNAPPTSVVPTPVHWAHEVRPMLPRVTSGLEASNWSGLIATGAVFTGVSGTWVVPTVQPSGEDQYSATWIGIDGVTDSSLIQAGTDQFSINGRAEYDAWYEILPAASVPLNEPVAPGDRMEASITQQSQGLWEIAIADVTANWLQSGALSYSGPGTTAEWIEEAPQVNGAQSTLADFGSAEFTNLGISGSSGDSASLVPVSMADTNGVIIAFPGPYDASTDSFPITFGTAPPVIDSVTPSRGSTNGGTSVTINGDYLTGASSVSFGGVAVPFRVNPDNSLTATSPAEAAGTVEVGVTTPGGTSAQTGADQFTYVQSPPVPRSSSGYDLVGQDGGVFAFPTGQPGGFYGSLPERGISVHDIVGMVPSPDDRGYFLVGQDGGVFAFGDAPFLGSLPGLGISVDDIVGIVPTPDDRGYFLVGQDGGVFAFGDAPFLGSLPGLGISVDDIVGIAATPSDGGYWVVAADGTVYAFGDAAHLGSASGTTSPVSGIASTPDGGGYWIVTRNGSVYPFGDAGVFGSLPSIGVSPSHPVIGLVPTNDDRGYWLVGSDGGIFAFGDAPFVGSLPSLGISVTDIVGAVPTSF